MCVLELGLFRGAAEMAFIIAPVQFNVGNANAFVCKGCCFFLYNFTFNFVVVGK